MKRLSAIFAAICLSSAAFAGLPFSLEGIKVEGSSDSFAERLIADCGMTRLETKEHGRDGRNMRRIRLQGSIAGYEGCLVDIVSHREDSIDMVSVIFPDLPTFELAEVLYGSIRDSLARKYGAGPERIRKTENISRRTGPSPERFRNHTDSWSSCIELGDGASADIRITESHRNGSGYSVVAAYFTGQRHRHDRTAPRPGNGRRPRGADTMK